MSGIPLQADCDMNDPEQHFLWSYVNLPMDPTRGVPLLTHPDVLRVWSRRQWDAGFRHHPELQTIAYVPLPVPSGAYAAPGPWEPIADAKRIIAEREASAAADATRIAEQVTALMPDLAARIDAMSETDKAAAREDMKAALQEQMRQMQDLLARIDTDEQA